MTGIVEALLPFNSLTDLQKCLEFPAGLFCYCFHFGVGIQPYYLVACTWISTFGLFLDLWYMKSHIGWHVSTTHHKEIDAKLNLFTLKSHWKTQIVALANYLVTTVA